jgi:DNA repair exonuclease SbcCD ATPase subunit
MKERQIVSAKLEILRKSLELSVSDLNAQLEGLRLENKSLEKKKALGSDALKDLEFRKNLVKENYLKTAQLFNGLKKEKEREFKENEKRREEYNQITMKIAFLKNQISKEDDLGEENFSGEDVRAEIVEIKKSLDRIDKKVHRKERKNKEVNKRITENNIVIEELMGKFNEIKENPSNGLALEEVQRLDELKRQLNDLDALILILEKRKNLTIDIQERRSEANQERRSEVIRSKDQESFQFKERKTFHFMVLPCEESLPLDIQNEKSIKSQKNDNLLRVKKKKKHENGSETESKTETKSRECDRYCSNCDII